jgi:hypothetical protein
VAAVACPRRRRYRSAVSPEPAAAASRSEAPARFSPLEYRDPAPKAWLIRLLGVINRRAMLPGLLKIRRFDLPEADLARLRGAVHAGTAAFLGPNHPEFLTDWLVDKEVSRLCSPLMAHWASYEIVNASPLARAFWLANNLIANVPGGGGKAYSMEWARRGHGVLLHPEGTATWQAGRVSALLPGLVDMAWEAAGRLRAASESRPVLLVPVAWRFVFQGDARRGLARDMERLEQGLQLPAGGALSFEERFAALLRHLLVKQCERLGLSPPALEAHAGYFTAQAATLVELRDSLAERYGELDADVTRAQFQLRKAMRERATQDPEGVRRDRGRLLELMRLASLDPLLYDRPQLAQERIAEVLKRTRSSLLTRGFANVLHNTIPVAAGPRTVHVRVAEPVAVHTVWNEALPDGGAAAREALLAAHRQRLQSALDELGRELAPQEARFAVRNLLHQL